MKFGQRSVPKFRNDMRKSVFKNQGKTHVHFLILNFSGSQDLSITS